MAGKMAVPEQRLVAWENGQAMPTFRQAKVFAHKAHVPLGYFYLNEPPGVELPLPDLRTVGSRNLDAPSAELIEIIQVMQQRQSWYREYLLAQGEGRNEHVGRYDASAAVEAVVDDMRAVLDVPAVPRKGNWEDYIRLLIKRIEAAGVLVMRQRYVHHHTRPLSVTEFRGFALYDPIAPLIFVNQADVPKAQLFTLIHELAHIWVGASGVSDAKPDNTRSEEVFCNAVAAEFLVPQDALRSQWRADLPWQRQLVELEAVFRVSTWVLARRALTLGLMTQDQYQSHVDQLQAEYQNQPAQSDGPTYYRTKKAQISDRFSRALVAEALSGRMLLRDASELLDIKPNKLVAYASELGI
jgi:Zn-dependent peptidase ImmA (M78 family)